MRIVEPKSCLSSFTDPSLFRYGALQNCNVSDILDSYDFYRSEFRYRFFESRMNLIFLLLFGFETVPVFLYDWSVYSAPRV